MRRIPILILMLSILLAGAVPVARADNPVQRAIAWLHTQQRPDGSFGGASVTADVVYVLALAGENPAGSAWTPPGGQSALNALAVLAPGYVSSGAGQAGRVARAVALAGGNPRAFGGLDLIDIIQKAYNPATGRYHPTLLYNHTLAVEGLKRSGVPVPTAALDALLRAQLPDGGWFWSFDGEKSDVDTTGRVMQLMAGQIGLRCAPGYSRAANYLAAAQLATGGWGVYPPPDPNLANANSTGLAVAGLKAAGFDPDAPPFQKNGLGAQASLLAFQEASGAFVYIRQMGMEEVRLMATADALNALVQPMAQPATCWALYLPLVLRQG
jgi:hypothetical protein